MSIMKTITKKDLNEITFDEFVEIFGEDGYIPLCSTKMIGIKLNKTGKMVEVWFYDTEEEILEFDKNRRSKLEFGGTSKVKVIDGDDYNPDTFILANINSYINSKKEKYDIIDILRFV